MFFDRECISKLVKWFLSQNGQRGSLLVFLALFCVWTKSLMCKDVVNRDSTFRVMSRLEEIQVPCLPSGRCVIPSGRPSVYCSIRPDDVSSRSDTRQSSIFRPDDVLFQSWPLLYIEKVLTACYRPDVSAARPDAYQFSNGSLILSKFQEREDQSTVWTRFSIRQESQFKIDRPDVWSSWSERTLIVNENCGLKFSRPDALTPWSGRAKPDMEITCDGCAFVLMIEPSRSDDVLIQERFLRKNFKKSCRTVVLLDVLGSPSVRLLGKFFLMLILTSRL